MPAPSRDRLPRPVDISTLYRGAARRVHLIVDEPGLRWAGLSGNGSNGARVLGQRAIGPRRNFHRFPAAGRENIPPVIPVRRGGTAVRGRRSILPHWYPRTPLRDITGIVRAIERRRAELQADQTTEQPQENITNEPSISGALFEHNEIGASTPLPTILMKPQPSPSTQAMKIMDHITLKDIQEDPDFLTPQKKLLESIEKVREVWLEEQRKLERTPAAKKAERERKVRVLMSMR